MKSIFIILFCFISLLSQSQNRGNKWCFGNNAGIDFTNANQPVPFQTAMKTRGSCVSICDTNSNLLFYAYTRAGTPGHTTLIKNSNHQLMLNGNNVAGRGWYSELVIVPAPDDATKYYVFSAGVTTIYGLYYSIIDMSLDSGRGAVTQKNIQLLSDPITDGITAIKHGNGRDWWILMRNDGYYSGGTNNIFYAFLVSSDSVVQMPDQYIGNILNSSFQRLIFDKEGNRMALVANEGLIEIYDFDRCSGMLSNTQLIIDLTAMPTIPHLWSGDFSADGRFLYVGTCGYVDSSYLIQVDLQNPQPWQHSDTIGSFGIYAGLLKRGPNDKIYHTAPAVQSGVINYPYADSVYNLYNMNLSVINSPDSLGAACDFQPYSFYLDSGRTYWGLPNNPDYDMPRLQGSPCDTIQWVGLPPNQTPIAKGDLKVFYHPDWDIAFINASNLKGRNCFLTVYDVTGKKVFETKQQTINGGYFTYDFNCNFLNVGLYIIKLQTEKETLSAKFVKN